MARKKSKKDRDTFTQEGMAHRPKVTRFHIAQEVVDLHGRGEETPLTRHLMPWARDCATGALPGTTTHKGWVPSVRGMDKIL